MAKKRRTIISDIYQPSAAVASRRRAAAVARDAAAVARDIEWRRIYAAQQRREWWQETGRLFLRGLLWAFFLAVMIVAAAALDGAPVPHWLVAP